MDLLRTVNTDDTFDHNTLAMATRVLITRMDNISQFIQSRAYH